MARSARRLRTVRSVRYTRGGLGVGPGRGGGAPSPLSLVSWRQAFWAGDPKLGVADGGAVSTWPASGSSWGAYTDAGLGLVLPGTTGNYASTPDTAALSITGDITLVCRAALTDWTPGGQQAFIAKYSGNYSYLLYITGAGIPTFVWSADGTTPQVSTCSAAVSFADGATGWLAVTLDVDDGAGNKVTKFWTSTDGTTWTQLGSTLTVAGTTSIYDGTMPLEIGSFGTGASYNAKGSISVARVYSGSGFSAAGPSGSLVFDADFRRASTGGFTADTGQNVVINSAPWGAVLDTARGMVLPGTAGNYASTPDSAALSITGDITLVAKAALTDWTPASEVAVIAKYVTTGNQRSYYLAVDATTGKLRIYWSSDGTAGTLTGAVSSVAPTVVDGAVLWVAAALDVDNGGGSSSATFWTSTDGSAWTQLGATVTGTKQNVFDGTGDVTVGCDGGLTRNVTGSVQVARIYSGSGFSAAGPSGTLVFDADFRRDDAPSFTASTGQAVTINSTFNAVQGTGANQPTFRSSTAAFNGRPTVQFDGGDYLASGAGAAQSQPITVVVVGQVTDLGTGAVRTFCDGISAARMAVCSYQTGNKWRIIGTSSLDLDGADTSVHMLRAVFNGASSEAFEDGTSQGTGTTGAAVTPTAMTIGASYLGGNQLVGHVAFIGWYVGDITAAAGWAQFKQWVRSHYGLTVA